MDKKQQIIQAVAEVLKDKGISIDGYVDSNEIPNDLALGISGRHVHLTQEDLDLFFGKGYELTPVKDLNQPGQFACKETVTLVGPKGSQEKVRILGPVRKRTQVEVLLGDCFKLGIKPVVRQSGKLDDASPITVVGPKSSRHIEHAAIVAARHIHMTLDDAKRYNVHNGQVVSIRCEGDRTGILEGVVIRANDNSFLECHLDNEEANALGLANTKEISIIR